jgi:biopolymer transport protein ExbD
VANKVSRARAARESRRQQQFAKFKLAELNLVPLVDTLVSIVFFALATQTVGELVPVMEGVSLPQSRIGANALKQLTLGVGRQVTLAGAPVMNSIDAAEAASNDPQEPLLIPTLYSALQTKVDSIRKSTRESPDLPIDTPLAIQGDRSMRYDLLSRIMQTARMAGFKNISLQVRRVINAP